MRDVEPPHLQGNPLRELELNLKRHAVGIGQTEDLGKLARAACPDGLSLTDRTPSAAFGYTNTLY